MEIEPSHGAHLQWKNSLSAVLPLKSIHGERFFLQLPPPLLQEPACEFNTHLSGRQRKKRNPNARNLMLE